MKVLTAESGADAIGLLRGHAEIDVVLMDIMMRRWTVTRPFGASGRARVETLRSSRLPPSDEGDREQCLAAGASEYISKPVDIDQLVALIRVWLNVAA